MKKETPKKEIKIDNLAQMIAKGFGSVDGNLKTIHGDMRELEKRLTSRLGELEDTLTNRINGVERRIDDLALNRATRDDVYKIDRRLIRVERKVELK